MSTSDQRDTSSSERRRAMRIMAHANAAELLAAIEANWPTHGARDLKPAETGLVMLRGRIGGDGAAFNVGEATVTRTVLQLPTGERGYGHVLGRDAAHARAVAILDALYQQPRHADGIRRQVLDPIEARMSRARADAAAETAATRVDFFTLVRGDV